MSSQTEENQALAAPEVAAEDAKSASFHLPDSDIVVDPEDSDSLSVNGIKLEGVSLSANSELGEAGGDTGSSHGQS